MSAQAAIRQAAIEDLDALVPLFDAYRQFYRKAGDLELARTFLLERFRNNQSIVFLASSEDNAAAVGFTQLFPSFSSVAAARIFILNDLYVVPSARRVGVAKSLLRAAAQFAKSVGAVRLTLSTEITNISAQALYESEGWVRSTDFYVYNLAVSN